MSSASRCWAVVPAAGVGARMAADRPKQYLPLAGKTVLQHSLERLAALDSLAGIVVALGPEDPYWPRLALDLGIPLMTVVGGRERCHSVLNALERLAGKAAPDDWVMVHDAARPCVRLSDLRQLEQAVRSQGRGGLLASRVRDTMKRGDATGQVRETVAREDLWHALTPQMFPLQALRQALAEAIAAGRLVTDEASAMEQQGYRPLLVEGHADNIKITRPEDLALAGWYLQQQEAGA